MTYGDGTDNQQSSQEYSYPQSPEYTYSQTPYWQPQPSSFEMSRLSISDRTQQIQGQPSRTVPERRDSDDRAYSDITSYSPVRHSSGNSSDSETNTFNDRSASALTHTPFVSSQGTQAAQAHVPMEGHAWVEYSTGASYNQPNSQYESHASVMSPNATVFHEGSHIAARGQFSHPLDRDLAGAVVNAPGSSSSDPAFLASYGRQITQMNANLEFLAKTAASDRAMTPEWRKWAVDRIQNYDQVTPHQHYATGGNDLVRVAREGGVPETSATMLQARWIMDEAQRRADSGGQIVADIKNAMRPTPPAGAQQEWLAAGNIPGPKRGKAWNKEDQADRETSKSKHPWRETRPMLDKNAQPKQSGQSRKK